MESTELRYVDLKNYICRQIYEGVYQDGEKIPSERQMAADYEVSRITVRKALELLEEEELTDKSLLTAIRQLYDQRESYIAAMKSGSHTDSIRRILSLIQECAKN